MPSKVKSATPSVRFIPRKPVMAAPLLFCPNCERQTVHTTHVSAWGSYLRCCECGQGSW